MKAYARGIRWCNLLLEKIEGGELFAGILINFLEGKTSDGGAGLFTRNELQGMLEGSEYCALDGVFPVVAVLFDRGRRHE